jgi:transposase InsO family protein
VRKPQIYAVVKRFADKYTVSDMCRFYNVSRSGYYDWAKREQGENPDQDLIDMITECHKQHKRRFGYRRVVKWLKREKGLVVNHKKVWRITNRNNMLSVIRRKKPFTYKPNGNLRYENVMNRQFGADRPNQKWVTDISYIIVPEGTLYLSAIRDLCGDFIVAHKTARRQDYSLVKNTIEAAVAAEKPPKELILHSDGGGQYRSWDYHFQVAKNGIIPSMSKPATPGDNAMAENFFSTFKAECIYLEKPKTLAEAEMLTEEFVYYYNYERIQGNGLTPFEERESAAKTSGTLSPNH